MIISTPSSFPRVKKAENPSFCFPFKFDNSCFPHTLIVSFRVFSITSLFTSERPYESLSGFVTSLRQLIKRHIVFCGGFSLFWGNILSCYVELFCYEFICRQSYLFNFFNCINIYIFPEIIASKLLRIENSKKQQK